MKTFILKLKTIITTYLCSYDLYGPVRNAFDVGSIHYLGKWEGVGPWKSRVSWGYSSTVKAVNEERSTVSSLSSYLGQAPQPPRLSESVWLATFALSFPFFPLCRGWKKDPNKMKTKTVGLFCIGIPLAPILLPYHGAKSNLIYALS